MVSLEFDALLCAVQSHVLLVRLQRKIRYVEGTVNVQASDCLCTPVDGSTNMVT